MITNTMRVLNTITEGGLTLGRAIGALRLCEKIKQADFAKMLAIIQSYLSDSEPARQEVIPQKAAEIAKILGHSEKKFIRLAVQDILRCKGFHYQIDVHDAI